MAYPGVVDDFKACCELRTPSRTPVFALGLEFDMALGGLSYEEGRTDVAKTVDCTVRMVERFDYDWAMVFPDDYIEFEPLGLSMRHEPDGPAMVAEYLPMTPETLSGLALPGPDEGRMPVHLEMIRQVKAALGDTVCVGGRIASPFSALALVYGIETLMVNMLADPGLIHDNLDFFSANQIAFGKAQIAAGADFLWLGDCVAASHFISPGHFADFAAGSASAVASALTDEALVVYHTCEISLPHLRLQTDLPVSAVNVGEGVSIAAIKKELGPKKCLMGNFDPMPLRDGVPEQVAEATERMVRENAPGGGCIFNTGEGVMANSPPENVAAMMRTAKALQEELAGQEWQ